MCCWGDYCTLSRISTISQCWCGSEDEAFLQSLQMSNPSYLLSVDEFETYICRLESASLCKLLARVRVRSDAPVAGGGTDEAPPPCKYFLLLLLLPDGHAYVHSCYLPQLSIWPHDRPHSRGRRRTQRQGHTWPSAQQEDGGCVQRARVGPRH